MRLVRRYEAHSIRTTPHTVTYWFEVYDQPLKDLVAYRLYHWYDMRFPIKIPGWQKFTRWLGNHGAEMVMFMPPDERRRQTRRLRDRLLKWDIAQDLRCYELSQRNVTVHGKVQVDEVTYKQPTRWW